MDVFRIQGGKKLQGTITPQGAKNEALQVICASLLTDQPVIIHNVPNILDIQWLIELITHLGVEVKKLNKNSYQIHAKKVISCLSYSYEFITRFKRIRGSVMLLAPLLVRCGDITIPYPGGDKIGRRSLHVHFDGLKKLGVYCMDDKEDRFYTLQVDKLKGTYILLEEASVTGTANIIMAATFAQGTTTIYNAACEPYVQQLCKMLVQMGAKIQGIGSNLLTIEGVNTLQGTVHTLLPDMIEIGSFIGLAAMTMSEIKIQKASISQLGMLPKIFQKLGITIISDNKEDSLYIPAQKNYTVMQNIDQSVLTIADAIWPGCSPDLLSILLVTAIQATGTVLIHQKMFESRLFFVDKLIDMGAKIILSDPHRATVLGLGRKLKLRGMVMHSPDIRAGVALLIAALSAQGESIIYNIYQIDRGYEELELRLKILGADIDRIRTI